MTLKSRLSQLQAQAGARPSASTTMPNASNVLRQRLAHLRPQRIQPQSATMATRLPVEKLAIAVGGELIGDGLIRIVKRLPLTNTIGSVALEGIATVPRLPGEQGPLPGIYIDTETTGLAGGSGTLAFLIGVAQVRDEAIELTQFLITSFAAEAAMLRKLLALLPADHKLVSYNGKSYDLPLLTTRLRLHGLQHELVDRPHLDLLHPVRRLFARQWEDCRLISVEQRLLGFHRVDDLPGAEAPEAWFAYMRGGYATKLIKVVEHNAQDILSLAAIHHTLSRAVVEPAEFAADLYGLGRWLSEADEGDALALLLGHQQQLCDDGLRLLAHLLRREERWELAVPIWEQLADSGCIDSIERLAKFHEHVSRDLHAAWHYCERLPGTAADRKRRDRLAGKLAELSC